MDFVQPPYPPTPQPYTDRDMSKVTYAIVHHSDTALSTTPLDIWNMHIARGFNGIGYHCLIDQAGIAYTGRPLAVVPAAAEGFNTDSVDVCLIGDFQSNDPGYNGPPSIGQIDTLVRWLVEVHRGIPSIIETVGHGDLMADDCPGNIVKAMLPNIRERLHAALR